MGKAQTCEGCRAKDAEGSTAVFIFRSLQDEAEDDVVFQIRPNRALWSDRPRSDGLSAALAPPVGAQTHDWSIPKSEIFGLSVGPVQNLVPLMQPD